MDKIKLSAFLLMLLTCSLAINYNCTTSNTLVGCLTCPNNTYIVFNNNNMTNVCTDIENCIQVAGNACISCSMGTILINGSCINGSTNACLTYNTNNICI